MGKRAGFPARSAAGAGPVLFIFLFFAVMYQRARHGAAAGFK
ncbi:MAG: hypothetical protein PHV33_14630 [Elusimicrobiales bacterium]|nr:hypothetical protein [Elusimicrobiales bacterium]